MFFVRDVWQKMVELCKTKIFWRAQLFRILSKIYSDNTSISFFSLTNKLHCFAGNLLVFFWLGVSRIYKAEECFLLSSIGLFRKFYRKFLPTMWYGAFWCDTCSISFNRKQNLKSTLEVKLLLTLRQISK